MLKMIKIFEKAAIYILVGLMMLTLTISIIELFYLVYQQIISPPLLLLDISELLTVLSFFLMVLIVLELLETVTTYLENKFHLEIIVIVAIIAVARKVIILDYQTTSPQSMFGIAAIILALSLGYYFIKKVQKQ